MRTCVINDPLYGSIVLRGAATEIIDTPRFQKLRDIRQLGYAYLVYPTAEHTRFQHPVGAYHLFVKTAEHLMARGDLTPDDEEAIALGSLSMLTHDVGHFPGAHVLEEYGLHEVDHERAGERWIAQGEIGEILSRIGIPNAAERVAAIIRHEGDHPLFDFVAGEVDADRSDYMKRDAFYCGLEVSYNQNRLLESLTIGTHPKTGKPSLMLMERGLNSLDQMLFLRYNLYSQCYWHPVVRSASAMARTILLQSIRHGIATVDEVQSWSDKQMFHVLNDRLEGKKSPELCQLRSLLSRLETRQLHHVAVQAPIGTLPRVTPAEALEVERYFADKFGLQEGDVLLDVPHKPGMYEPDIWIQMKNGDILHRSELSAGEHKFTANASADAWYAASGSIALFVSDPNIELSVDVFLQGVEDALPAPTACAT